MRLPLVVLLLAATTPTLLAQGTSRGVQLFESRDRAGARAEFSAAVHRNDRDARAHYYLGRPAMIDNDVATSFMHVERAVKLEANVSDYHAWYGNAVAQQASRASKLKHPILARRMKSALERAAALGGRNLDGRDVLLDFYSTAPDRLRTCSALAIWCARVKKWPEAFATLDRHIAKRAEARNSIEHAVTLDPHNEDAEKALASLR